MKTRFVCMCAQVLWCGEGKTEGKRQVCEKGGGWGPPGLAARLSGL